MKPLYLVDASIYIFRSWFSIPDRFFSREGRPVNAVYGYTVFLLDLLERRPDYISFAFDESLTTCFRNSIYPDYKANRDLPDANLEYQLARCREITGLLGLHNLSLEDYEADDIIGTLIEQLAKKRPVVILTRDKDLGQLLRRDDRLWDYAADRQAGPGDIALKFGVRVDQLADFLALAGDPVDNIPGAPGIGTKTAAKLLTHFGSLDDLFDRADEIAELDMRGSRKIRDTVQRHEENIRVYREITGIRRDIPVSVKLSELKIKPPLRGDVEAFCEAMAFGGRLRDRIGKLTG